MKFDTFTYWYPERPVLVPPASPLIDKLSEDPRWIAQPKLNERRLILHFINEEWQFWNRHNKRFDFKPDKELKENLAELASWLKGYWCFDGGLRHNKVTGIKSKVILWDVFLMNGEMLNNRPYWERGEILQTAIHFDLQSIRLIQQYPDHFRSVFSDIIKDPEIEGIVMKNLDGKLNLSRTSGQDSAWMMKCRKPNNSYRF